MTHGASPDRIARLTTSYLAADYRWEHDGVWHRLAIGAPAPDLDAAFPEASRFGLMTAANPGQQMRADIDNRSADRALQRRMEALGLRYRPAFVAAPNRVWRAYNWLIIGPEVDAFDDLVRAFGQIGSLLWPRGAAVRLRMRASAPDASAALACVDWVPDRVEADGTGSMSLPADVAKAKTARSP